MPGSLKVTQGQCGELLEAHDIFRIKVGDNQSLPYQPLNHITMATYEWEQCVRIMKGDKC